MDVDLADETLEALLEDVLEFSGLDLTFDLSVDATATPAVCVEFEGADLRLLLDRRAELLLALEHLATQVLRLQPDEHELVSFDAGAFKAGREQTLRAAADQAVAHVRSSGRPYRFPPMSSRERRLLHLLLAPTGLQTASEGIGPARHLVLHPARGSRR